MGNIPPGGRGAAGGFHQRGQLSPWHPPGPPGLGRSWSDHKMLTEGAALLPLVVLVVSCPMGRGLSSPWGHG